MLWLAVSLVGFRLLAPQLARRRLLPQQALLSKVSPRAPSSLDSAATHTSVMDGMGKNCSGPMDMMMQMTFYSSTDVTILFNSWQTHSVGSWSSLWRGVPGSPVLRVLSGWGIYAVCRHGKLHDRQPAAINPPPLLPSLPPPQTPSTTGYVGSMFAVFVSAIVYEYLKKLREKVCVCLSVSPAPAPV